MPAVRLSRYEFAPVHQDASGRLFLDVPDPIPRRVRSDDARAVVGTGDTLDAISWRAYKATLDRDQDVRPTSFYWAIAQVNGIVDVTEKIEDGTILRVPSIENLFGEILVPPVFYRRNSVT